MDTTHTPQKRADYREILDTPLAPIARKIAVSLLTAHSVKDIQNDTGANRQYIHEATDKPAVTGLTTHAMTKKQEILDQMIVELDNIIDLTPETPLKYSDKLKAIELKAKLSGVTDSNTGDTYNVGIFDLRNATEEELVKELDRIERSKRNIIDVTPIV